jgi:hypothetical protein
MPFYPVDLVRLFDSDLYALSTGEEFKAAFTLWGRAFLQAPAGSLPKQDKILAHLSNTGNRWRNVKSMALRGWIECADGRLYHPVVAEKVKEAWAARQAQRSRTEAARAARARLRQTTETCTTENVTTSVTETVTGSKGQGQGQGQLEKKKTTPQPPALGSTGGASANDSQGEEAAEDRPPGWQGQWRGLRSTGGNPRAQASPPPPPPIAEPTDPLWPRLRAQGVKPHDWRAWIARLHRETLPTGETRIIAPNAAHAAYVRANYAIALAAALRTRIVVEVASA